MFLWDIALVALYEPNCSRKPAAWATLLAIAREDGPLEGEPSGPYMRWLASRLVSTPKTFAHGPRQMNAQRMVGAFVKVIQKSDGSRRAAVREQKADDAKSAGTLFLAAWDTATKAAASFSLSPRSLAGAAPNFDTPTGVTPPQSSAWTSSDAVEAFADWFCSYEGRTLETVAAWHEDKVNETIIRHDLVLKFMQHASRKNPLASAESGIDAALRQLTLIPGSGNRSSSADMEAWEPARKAIWGARRHAVSSKLGPTWMVDSMVGAVRDVVASWIRRVLSPCYGEFRSVRALSYRQITSSCLRAEECFLNEKLLHS
ncbi:hypothetical protein FRB93_010849 [Tulasnella sp. JGI-2019a]|nr:hypothetical protein FRB93_010849 [Tulasnella sp. JGI-2019a]